MKVSRPNPTEVECFGSKTQGRRMNKRIFTLVIILLVCVLGLGVATFALAPKAVALPTLKKPDFSRQVAFEVIRVIDGDTILVKTDTGSSRVRLIGVDTPETFHPSKPIEYYGKEASLFLTNFLKGERVYLLYEGEKASTDKYNRVLSYIYRTPDGLFANAEIIRQGYGRAYTRFPFKYKAEFRQLEQFAKQAKKGLWEPKAQAVKVKRVPRPAIKPAPRLPTKTISNSADKSN